MIDLNNEYRRKKGWKNNVDPSSMKKKRIISCNVHLIDVSDGDDRDNVG